MVRAMVLAALGAAFLVTTADQSYAGATGKSFTIEVSDGTDAAAAFDVNGTVLVHVPGADVSARYVEFGAGILTPSFIFAFTISEDYSGFFFANCSDPLNDVATISGSGYGTTGAYTFVGVERE